MSVTGGCVKHRLSFIGLEWIPCISDKPLGDACAACLKTVQNSKAPEHQIFV